MLDDYEKDSKALKKQLFKLCWYMRGGLSADEAWVLSPSDRSIITDIINDNIKTTNEIGMPFY